MSVVARLRQSTLVLVACGVGYGCADQGQGMKFDVAPIGSSAGAPSAPGSLGGSASGAAGAGGSLGGSATTMTGGSASPPRPVGTIDSGTPNPNDAMPSAATPTASGSNCGADQLPAGDHPLSMMFGGVVRSYIARVPVRTNISEPRPLLLDIHGLTSNAAQESAYTAGSAAEKAGYFLVFPEGLEASWNAGDCCGGSAAKNVDDVGYLVALVGEVARQLCVDKKRVYATGMSNGGFMSHRLACEAANVFAAVAPVAGMLGIPPATCKPSRPVPVLHFHGKADAIVPYEGGGIVGVHPFRSARASFEAWAKIDGCTGPPTNTFSGTATTCETYAQCNGGVEVTLCSSTGATHCWPGVATCPFLGTPALDIVASDMMFKMFERYALP
jgi:polyhydroxybutyrate depolymerase